MHLNCILLFCFVLQLQLTAQSTDEVPLLASGPTDFVERNKQELREKGFDRPGHPPIDGQPGTVYPRIPTTVLRESLPEFPVNESDVVAVGDVSTLQFFLTKTKTALFTEITFTLTQVIKSSRPLTPSSQISVLRLGGTARKPDGQIIRHVVKGTGGALEIGKRYLLFLHYAPDEDAYLIGKIWGIREGHIWAWAQDDVSRVHKGQSEQHGKPLDEVILTLTALNAR